MPQGQFYPAQKLVEAPEVHDGLITYNAGLISNTATGTQPTVPGSAVSTTNIFGINYLVYLSGGTLLQTTVSGHTVATTGTGPFFLPPNATIAVSYSSAPSWYWQAM